MTRPMTIGITGSSGFLGSSLIPFLTTGGHRVVRLVRHPVQSRKRQINSVESFIDLRGSILFKL
jgi:uncharacterized protein